MTRRQWLASLRRRGVRLSLEGENYLRLRGPVTMSDRRRLQQERTAIVALLRARRRRREQQQEVTEQKQTPPREIVGEQLVEPGGVNRERRTAPLFRNDVRSMPPREWW